MRMESRPKMMDSNSMVVKEDCELFLDEDNAEGGGPDGSGILDGYFNEPGGGPGGGGGGGG